MTAYSMALAYRGLFALLPFALLLVAVLGFLHMDAFPVWQAGLAAPGPRGSLPDPFGWLEVGVLGQTEGGLPALGIVLGLLVGRDWRPHPHEGHERCLRDRSRVRVRADTPSGVRRGLR